MARTRPQKVGGAGRGKQPPQKRAQPSPQLTKPSARPAAQGKN